jgi:radical SAM superfamily enzyme YgiQ (UPF0313 family)/intein/homing endonuclease
MKILLLRLDYRPFKVPPPYMPIGILYLASSLEKEGFEVKVIDLNKQTIEEFWKEIKDSDILGISMLAAVRSQGYNIINEVKKLYPEKKILLGGAFPASISKALFSKYPIDAIIAGEGEKGIVYLCNKWKNNKKVECRVYNFDLLDINSIPFPAWKHSDFNWWKFQIAQTRPDWTINGVKIGTALSSPIIASRGCIARCTFCLSGEDEIITSEGLTKIKNFKSGFIATDSGFEHGVNYYMGIKNTIKIKTFNGTTITLTPNHKIRIINSKRKYQWLEARKLKIGDNLAFIKIDWSKKVKITEKNTLKFIQETNGTSKQFIFPSQMSKDLAWLIGYCEGDAHYSQESIVIYANSQWEKDKIIDLFKILFNINVKWHKSGNGSPMVRFPCCGKNFVAFMKKAKEKITLPFYKDFLGGYIQADGCGAKSGYIITTTNEKNANKLLKMAWACGIKASKREYINKSQRGKEKNRFHIYLGGHNINDLITEKVKNIKNIPKEKKGWIMNIPPNVERKNITVDKVISIYSTGMTPVYDINIANQNHSFYVNGMIVHNCNAFKHWNYKVRFRTGKNIADEIEELVTKHNVTLFSFDDDAFPINKQQCLELCQEIKNRNLKVAWKADTRIDRMDKEMLEAMKEAGCFMLAVGIESGSPTIIKNIKKNIDLEKAKQTIKLIKDVGIIAYTLLMIGNPGETEETIKETIKFLEETKPNVYSYVTGVMVVPGTEMQQLAQIPDEYYAEGNGLPYYTKEHSLSELHHFARMIDKVPKYY